MHVSPLGAPSLISTDTSGRVAAKYTFSGASVTTTASSPGPDQVKVREAALSTSSSRYQLQQSRGDVLSNYVLPREAQLGVL